MKFRNTMIALGTVASLAVAASALASDLGARGFGGMRATPPEFATLDADGNGQLTRDELAAGMEAHRATAGQERLDQMAAEIMTFANPEGMLGADELRAALGGIATARHAAMEEMRAEGGRAGPRGAHRAEGRGGRHAEGAHGERAGGRQGRQAEAGGAGGSGMDRMFDRVDSDNDGTISAAEYDAVRARMAGQGLRGAAPSAQ
ncbi:hypothetical protein [Roseicitreum antarcticum]|uniref:EF hand n=1 Tax=Roseicitreum antarcticum TaxID=564137 RepID=A0A1H3C4A1_9RHOB|nr:hypothetical protein [Roseicitreum antarcticum]SDX48728.1 EF hand [Roseicitreum antarcticum]